MGNKRVLFTIYVTVPGKILVYSLPYASNSMFFANVLGIKKIRAGSFGSVLRRQIPEVAYLDFPCVCPD